MVCQWRSLLKVVFHFCRLRCSRSGHATVNYKETLWLLGLLYMCSWTRRFTNIYFYSTVCNKWSVWIKHLSSNTVFIEFFTLFYMALYLKPEWPFPWSFTQVKSSARSCRLVITGVSWQFHQVSLLKQDTESTAVRRNYFIVCKNADIGKFEVLLSNSYTWIY